MKILVATEKAFATVAVARIRELTEVAGHTLVMLENYKSVSELATAVVDADAMIVRGDLVTSEILDAAKKLKIVVRAGAGYDNLDLLTGITETRVSDNEIFRQEFYSYDKNALLLERLVQVKNNNDIWENTLRVEYVYDRYDRLIKRFNQSWINGAWADDVMRVYHYESDRTPKAEICHKGHTICVSVNAIRAHLAHGDYPGKCKVCETETASGNLKSASVQTFSDSESNIAVYPNPFNDKVFITLNEDHAFSRIEIFDYTGKLVRSIDNPDQGEIMLDMGDLPKGIYFLRATGAEIYSTKLISE